MSPTLPHLLRRLLRRRQLGEYIRQLGEHRQRLGRCHQCQVAGGEAQFRLGDHREGEGKDLLFVIPNLGDLAMTSQAKDPKKLPPLHPSSKAPSEHRPFHNDSA